MIIIRTVFLLALLHCPFAVAETADKPNRLKEFIASVQTYTADFEQIQLSEFGEELEVATGSFLLARPGKFIWHYSNPYAQRIISNGNVVWVFDEDLEQVTINSAANTIADAPTLIINEQVEIEQYYDITEQTLEDENVQYELLSRSEESQYRKVIFSFSAEELTAMQLHDALGQTTRISFFNSSSNPELDPETFEFEIPADIDVIDNRDITPPPSIDQ